MSFAELVGKVSLACMHCFRKLFEIEALPYDASGNYISARKHRQLHALYRIVSTGARTRTREP